MKLKIKDINEWVRTSYTAQHNDINFDEGPLGSIEDCFFECTNVVQAFMKRNGFYHDDEYIYYPFGTTADEYTQRANIGLLTQIIIEAYEGCFSQHDDFEDENGGNKFWNIFGCSGDDDVDYNSSYFDCTIEILEIYLIDNKIDSYALKSYNDGRLLQKNIKGKR